MSAAEEEVAAAIEETEANEPVDSGIDIAKASDQIAEDLFGKKPEPKDEVVETEIETDVSEENTEKISEKVEKDSEPEKELRPAPQSWKKEMHETWNGLTQEAQEYIELREQQMKEGIDVRKDDADLGMKMRDAMQPFDQVLKQNNIDPVMASQRMMATHFRLVSAQPEERKELFKQLAKSYGIEPESQQIESGDKDPKITKLENELHQLKQSLQATQYATQQEQQSRVNEVVADFASKHDHFDDLSDEIAKLIRGGYELDQAYKMAYRNSDFYEKDLEKERQKEIEKAEEAKKKEAEKAKKAKSVNVKGRDTGKAPTAPLGTMEDTMKDVMRQIKNRN
jgi:hypothetical protein